MGEGIQQWEVLDRMGTGWDQPLHKEAAVGVEGRGGSHQEGVAKVLSETKSQLDISKSTLQAVSDATISQSHVAGEPVD